MKTVRPRSPIGGGRAVAALLAVLLLLLAACGTDDGDQAADEPTEPTTEPEPTAEPTTEPEREPQVTVSVFFPREGEGDPCGDVFPVERDVAAEDPIGEAVVKLLEGPTDAEQAQGYGGWFSEETAGMFQGYREESGVLYLDFADFSSIIPNASTSCGSAALLAQLDQTLEQFPEAGEPRYSFDGDVAAFYEWLQLVPPGDG